MKTPCWICGSDEGEPHPSINDGPPYHKHCIDEFRAYQIRQLDALIELTQPHIRIWNKLTKWFRKV